MVWENIGNLKIPNSGGRIAIIPVLVPSTSCYSWECSNSCSSWGASCSSWDASEVGGGGATEDFKIIVETIVG